MTNYFNSIEAYLKSLDINVSDLLIEKTYPYDFMDAFNFMKEVAASGKPLYIIGDYDVDGLFSSEELRLIALSFGIKVVIIRIPKRFSEGYGLNMSIIDEIPENVYIITVDNGISANEAIEKAICLYTSQFFKSSLCVPIPTVFPASKTIILSAFIIVPILWATIKIVASFVYFFSSFLKTLSVL